MYKYYPIYRLTIMLDYILKCSKCGSTFNFSIERKLCSKCEQGLWLEVKTLSLDKHEGEQGIWKYGGVLPNVKREFRISLGEGDSPLQNSLRIREEIGVRELWIKDETIEPTGSYLDRCSALFVSVVLSMGYEKILTYSTGNLGASIAAYSSRAGIKTHVQVRPTIDLGKLYQMIIYGAEVKVVEAFREKKIKNTAVAVEYDPLINEAKKTIMLETFFQLNRRLPDYIILPMGEGGLVYATYRMLKDISRSSTSCKTRIIGVQSEDCKPIVNSFEKGLDFIEPESESRGRIFDVSVSNPKFGVAALRAIRETKGTAVSVGEKEVFEALSLLAEKEGILAEPAGSLPIAGLIKLVKEGIIERDSTVICVVTGSGLKDPKVMKEIAHRKSSLGALIEELSGGFRLSPTKTAILRLLSEKNMYGYQIWKGLREKYGICVKIPTVYQHLNELIGKGYVKKGESKTVMGRRREYYSLTERGEALV
ncbi:MAG: pyridoxal-phosphate dependent enzyme [Crenarchaeota archaeon]|nr:pyridoxal-phosphate dependent enzyme [Thermoproteota archaeon]MDW8034638.1 pyridoxal-phosphate dependent enzyme [Nitrososphaerota archaeon]